jgi:hypothetical protein
MQKYVLSLLERADGAVIDVVVERLKGAAVVAESEDGGDQRIGHARRKNTLKRTLERAGSMAGVGARGSRHTINDPSGHVRALCCVGKNQRQAPPGLGFSPRLGGLRGKISISCEIGPKTVQFLETLILIGFALRYHSKRREGSGSTAAERCSVRCD